MLRTILFSLASCAPRRAGMAGAAVWHITCGELQNLVIAALLGFVAYGRWKLSPLKDRNG